MRKTFINFFTIADYAEEEIWLREMSRSGWRLAKMTPPCFYTFESCEPEDVIYRLDFKNNMETDEYMKMADDFGWEYCGACVGWLYFRKSAAEAEAEGDSELFSDNASKTEQISKIIRKRMVPLFIIFLCAVIPNFVRAISGQFDADFWGVFFGGFFIIMFVIYVWLLTHCSLKLKKLKDEYQL